MIASISAEFFKLRKRPTVWYLAAAFALVIIMFGDVASYIGVQRLSVDDPDLARFQNQLLFESFSWSALSVIASIGGPIALVLGALISGSEYGWSTFKTALTQRPGRLNVLGGKIVALALFLAIFVIGGWIAAALGSLVMAAVSGYAVALPTFGSLAGGLAAGWLIAAVWGAIGLALGLIFRGTAMPIGLGLIWGLAAENIIGGFGGSIDLFQTMQRYLIGENAATLSNRVGISTFTADVGGNLSTAHALTVLIGYMVVLLSLGAYLFRTRDLT